MSNQTDTRPTQHGDTEANKESLIPELLISYQEDFPWNNRSGLFCSFALGSEKKVDACQFWLCLSLNTGNLFIWFSIKCTEPAVLGCWGRRQRLFVEFRKGRDYWCHDNTSQCSLHSRSAWQLCLTSLSPIKSSSVIRFEIWLKLSIKF